MTDRDTPVTALREALEYVEQQLALHRQGKLGPTGYSVALMTAERALRAALASSDDVAGSGERLRERIEALECPDKASMFDPSDRFATGWLVAINQVLEVLAAPTTEAPPKDAPEWPTLDDFRRMRPAQVNEFFAAIGSDWRVADD
jgi:hypothetical protein